MKKLLALLILPVLAFGQQFNGPADDTINGIPSDANVTIYYGGIVGDDSVPLNAVQVNDQIVLTLDIWNKLEGVYAATYAHVDFQYNKNALTLVSETYKTPSDAENFTWTQNAEFNPTNNYPVHSLWDQWQHGDGYQASTDYITKHYQSQKIGHDFGGDQGTLIEIVFQVNELPEGADWSKVVNLNMALLTDNPENFNFPLVAAYPNQSIDLDPRPDVDLGGVTVKLEFGANTSPENFQYRVLYLAEQNENGGSYWEAENFSPPVNFPANGIVDITDELIDPNKEYGIVIEWDYQDGPADFATYFQDVVTVSDYLLLFKELGQHGQGAINSGISMQNADVVSPFGLVDSNDAYKLLAHVAGVEHILSNDWNLNDETPISDRWYQALRIVKADDYMTADADSYQYAGAFGFLVPLAVDFTAESAQTFILNGTWIGDVNLSHSADVDSSVANTAKSVVSYGETKKVAGDVNVDFLVEEVDGKVHATFTVPEADLLGVQFVVKYDSTRLAFEEAVFDTGNASTNFANHHSPVVNFGSVNQDGTGIEAGTYKLIFNANNINGTTGLITVLATDGADSNADRVNVILN